MIKLNLRKIKREFTVGEIFANRRKEFNLSLEESAEFSKISKCYLQALEDSDYKVLPTEVYVKNFIKTYARMLNLDPEVLNKKYTDEIKIYQKINKREEIQSIIPKRSKKIKLHHFIVMPKLIKNICIIFIISLFLVYLGYEVKSISLPPKLIVLNPSNNIVIEDNYVEVIGEAGREVQVLINGQEILRDRDGKFTQIVNLNNGVNIIEILAVNKHGKETKEYRKIMVEGEQKTSKK